MISIPADFIVDQAYLDRLTREANAKMRGPSISSLSGGILCHARACTCSLDVPASGSPRTLQCERGHVSTVTQAQYRAERRRKALGAGEIAAQNARLAAIPRYPVCGCGGPLMLPEQAGKGTVKGHLFCGSCGVQTGTTYLATAEQIDKARAAAKAEGFKVSP